MKILDSLKQSKHLKSLIFSGIIIFATLIYLIVPKKEYFICQNRWEPVQTTVVVRSYGFGAKHSINEFNLFQCETRSESIYCENSISSFKFDRLTADYDVFKPTIQLYKCRKAAQQI